MSEVEIYEPTQNEVEKVISSLNSSEVNVYSSIKGTDFESRLAVARALTDSVPVADYIGETINVANFVIHPVEMADEETGEVRPVARTIIIDENGKAYHAISAMIVRRVHDLIGVLGEPSSWPNPLSMRVTREKGSGARFFYDLRLV